VIQQRLGGDVASAQWIMNAYGLMLGALVLAGGAAADRYGRKRVFIAGVALFTLASAACALAPSLPALIASRAVQGVGAALLTPASLALLGATFDNKAGAGRWASGRAPAADERGGSGAGRLADPGGVLARVFLINLPIAAGAVWLTALGARESRGQAKGPVDWAGAAVVTLGLGLITWGLTDAPRRGPDPRVVAMLAQAPPRWPASCSSSAGPGTP